MKLNKLHPNIYSTHLTYVDFHLYYAARLSFYQTWPSPRSYWTSFDGEYQWASL